MYKGSEGSVESVFIVRIWGLGVWPSGLRAFRVSQSVWSDRVIWVVL